MRVGAAAVALAMLSCATPRPRAEAEASAGQGEAKPSPERAAAEAPAAAREDASALDAPGAAAESETVAVADDDESDDAHATDAAPSGAPMAKPELGFDGVEHVAWAKVAGARIDLRAVYWATPYDRNLAIDTIHGSEAEFDALLPDEDAATGGRPDPESVSLEQFRLGEALTIVHPDGPPRAGTLAKFWADYGASDGHLIAEFDTMRDPPDEALVTRVGAADTAQLRRPRPGATTRDATRAAIEAVRADLAGEPAAKALRPRHVTASPLEHGAPGATLVVVAIPRFDPDEEPERWWSGAFVLTADGTQHVLVAADERPHRVLPRWLVDLEGDGIDEIVFETDYEESSGYLYLSAWTGSSYANLRLTGDGG